MLGEEQTYPREMPKNGNNLLYFDVIASLARRVVDEYSLNALSTSSMLDRNRLLRGELAEISTGILTHFAVKHEFSDKEVFGNWIDCSRDNNLVVFKMYYELQDQSRPDAPGEFDTFKEGVQRQSEAMEAVLKYCRAKTVDEALKSGFVKDGEGVVLSALTEDASAIDYLHNTDGWVRSKIQIPTGQEVKTVKINGPEITVETDSNMHVHRDVSLGTKISLDALPYFSSLTADFNVKIENGEIHTNGDYEDMVMWRGIKLSDQIARLHVEGGKVELISQDGEKQSLSYPPQIVPDDLTQTVRTVISEKIEFEDISGFKVSFLGCNKKETQQARKKIKKLVSHIPSALQSLLQKEVFKIHGQRSGQQPKGRASASGGMQINIGLQWLDQDFVTCQAVLIHEHQHNKDAVNGIYQMKLITDDSWIPIATICHGYVSLPLGEAFSEVSAYTSSYTAMKEILRNGINLANDQRSWLEAKIKEEGKFIDLGLEMLRRYPLTDEAVSLLKNVEKRYILSKS